MGQVSVTEGMQTVAVPYTVTAGATRTLLGLNSHAVWSKDLWEKNAYPLLPRGTPSVRVDVFWGSIENGATPSTLTGGGGSYDAGRLASADYTINHLAALGIPVLLTFGSNATGTPAGWPSFAPANGSSTPGLFANFVRFLVHRYGSKLDGVEVFNEPYGFGPSYLKGAAHLSAIQKTAYTAVKQQCAADGIPALPVSTGSTVMCQWGDARCGQLLTDYHNNGALDYCDAVSVHNYPWHVYYSGWGGKYPNLTYVTTPVYDPGTPAASIWGMYESEVWPHLQSWGYGDKPVWFTEFGWSTTGLDSPVSTDKVTEAQQGQKWAETVTALAGRKWRMPLERAYLFGFDTGSFGVIVGTGTDSSGNDTYRGTAALTAYQQGAKTS